MPANTHLKVHATLQTFFVSVVLSKSIQQSYMHMDKNRPYQIYIHVHVGLQVLRAKYFTKSLIFFVPLNEIRLKKCLFSKINVSTV